MILLKNLRNRHFLNLLKIQNPISASLNSLRSSEFLFLSSISSRKFSLCAQFVAKSNEKTQKRTEPLSSFFTNAIAVSERTNNGGVGVNNSETGKLDEKLRNLEQDRRKLNNERGGNRNAPGPISAQSDSSVQNSASISSRPFSLSAQLVANSDEKKTQKRTEPLNSVLKNAIAGSERTNNGGIGSKNSETGKLKEKLRNLEQDMTKLNKERGENGKAPSPSSAQIDSNEQNWASIPSRPFSLSSICGKSNEKSQKLTEPLNSFFKNAIPSSERTNNGGVGSSNSEAGKLKEKLRNLEQDMRKLNKERGENGKTPSPNSAQSKSSEQNKASISSRPFSLSAQFVEKTNEKTPKRMKPLNSFFKNAIAGSERSNNGCVGGCLEQDMRKLNKERSEDGKAPSPISVQHDSSEQNRASISSRPFSLPAQFVAKLNEETKKRTEPSSSFFKNAIVGSERINNGGVGGCLEQDMWKLNKERSENGKASSPLTAQSGSTEQNRASISSRPFSLPAQFVAKSNEEAKKRTEPSSSLFKNTIAGSERTNNGGTGGSLEEDMRKLNKERGENRKATSPISAQSNSSEQIRASISSRLFSRSVQFVAKSNEETRVRTEPSTTFFKNTIAASERTNNGDVGAKNSETENFKERMRSLEQDMRKLNKEMEKLKEKLRSFEQDMMKLNKEWGENGKAPSPISAQSDSGEQNRASISSRPFSFSAQFVAKSNEKTQKRTEPLSSFFKNAIAGSEMIDNGGAGAKNSETGKLKEKLRNLEQDMRKLNTEKGENGKALSPNSAQSDSSEQSRAQVNMSAFFTDLKEKAKSSKPTEFGYEDTKIHKELSADMQMFVHHLYMKGYFKDANFMPKNEFDLTCFEMSHGRQFLKFAAVKFGGDHREIARRLSASDLKKIALFGCPSRGYRPANAAKHMRSFFHIEEQKVCQKCPLKESCNLVSKTVKTYTQLDMAKVMRILIMYAMESVPEQLVVPAEIRASVSRLMKEIVKLSQTPS